MNITGLVKYVGKLGSGGGGSVFVGLKLDQPGISKKESFSPVLSVKRAMLHAISIKSFIPT